MGMAPLKLLVLSISLLLLYISLSGASRAVTLSSSSSSSSSSSYSTHSRKSDVDLAIVGINKTVSETGKLAKLIQKLQKKYRNGYDASALSDCVELVRDSRGLMKDSVKALKMYKKDGKESRVADVQTWLSGALTNVDTCYDGIKEGGSDGLKVAIEKEMDDVEMLMDVSLERVNDLRV